MCGVSPNGSPLTLCVGEASPTLTLRPPSRHNPSNLASQDDLNDDGTRKVQNYQVVAVLPDSDVRYPLTSVFASSLRGLDGYDISKAEVWVACLGEVVFSAVESCATGAGGGGECQCGRVGWDG